MNRYHGLCSTTLRHYLAFDFLIQHCVFQTVDLDFLMTEVAMALCHRVHLHTLRDQIKFWDLR